MKQQQHITWDERQRLSRSMLWQLQRNYFERHGIDAWRSGAVPHHITSSPYIADAYSRVVMGFLRDWSALKHSDTAPLDHSQPVHIVELGSGSGRFAKPAIAQAKMAGASHIRTHPVAPPVNRPQLKPNAVQRYSNVNIPDLEGNGVLSERENYFISDKYGGRRI